MTENNAEEGEPNLFNVLPKGSKLCTQSFSRFLSEFRGHIDLFLFLVRLVSNADKSRMLAAKALHDVNLREEDKTRYEEALAKPNPALDALKRHSTIVSQNLTNGVVNSFQRYFSSIIQEAATRKPMMIASSQMVRVDDVLKFTRHRDLVSFIIDRKINELSYGGLADMEKYFGDRLGIEMFQDARQRDLLQLFVEIRNINVHNGGVVNDVFSGRLGIVEGFPYKIGKIFHVDFDALSTLSENAMKVAADIDESVATKFKIQRRTYAKWRNKKK